MSGWLIENSTIDGAAKGLLLGGGRRNRVIGNRFANVAGPAILLDNRGLNWQLKNCKSTAPTSLGGRVKALLYPGSPWPVQYPELLNVTTDSECAPAYSQVIGNRYDASTVKNFLSSPHNQSSSWPGWHIVVANNTEATYHSEW